MQPRALIKRVNNIRTPIIMARTYGVCVHNKIYTECRTYHQISCSPYVQPGWKISILFFDFLIKCDLTTIIHKNIY